MDAIWRIIQFIEMDKLKCGNDLLWIDKKYSAGINYYKIETAYFSYTGKVMIKK